MNLMLRRSAYLGVVALLVLSASLGATVARGAGGRGQTAASALNGDWPRFGNSTDNTQFSPLAQINTSNVSRLGIAWTMSEGPHLSQFEDDPVVVNGIMYITTGLDQVIAVKAATGQVLWKYTPSVNFYLAVHGGGGGFPTSRGVTVSHGIVYLLTYDDQLIALQGATGEKLWGTRVADPKLGYSETSPPTYWNGMLFVGSAASDSGMRGFVAAFNATTGKQVWRFYTVPAPGQGWMPATGQHGGGDVWMPPTIDTQTGLLYFGTGNPSPDFVNTGRPGCDPWVDSTVALDAKTGKFVWGHTQLCPDLWDYDSHQPPILFTIHRNGKTIRAVGQGNKEGHVWIFDAATGKVLAISPALSKEILPRPKPTPKGVKVCPGAAGGIEYSPAAYSPLTQAVYEPGLNLCNIFTSATPAQIALHKVGGVDSGGSAFPTGKASGTMSAVDVNTGKILWHDELPMPCVGGALATAGNLVFSGCDDGRFYAFNARTGKILWSANLGLGFGAAPIAYAVNGTEYIAVAVGGSIISTLDGAKLGGTFVVFKLGGKPAHRLPTVSPGKAPVTGLPSLHGLTRINPWMYVNAKTQSLVWMVKAAATPANSGFNFDGYAKGQATFVIPLGWAVTIEFSNKAALPHSMAIASSNTPNPKLPIFGFGPVVSATPLAGIGPGVTQVLGFNTTQAGTYYLDCLVPGHIQSGMWDRFTISATAKLPLIQTK